MQRPISRATHTAAVVLPLLAALGGAAPATASEGAGVPASAAAPPPASAATHTPVGASPPAGASGTPGAVTTAATPSAAAAGADEHVTQAKEFAKRYGYRMETRGDTIMFCREEKTTGSRVRVQRRCVTEDAARQEAENATQLLDRANRGFTPRDAGT